ncbi:hypothetical protein, partial [uncultured Duncaniella sp.]|uniref:hypothetical protein n=1 Tax=uncultured Duncaniella sp. TaxID=2768039 RepID=UPI0025AF88CC
TKHFSRTEGKGFLSGEAILVKLKPPQTERLPYSTVSSLGATMLLAGCSSAEPVSSSGCTSKLLFFSSNNETMRKNN